MADDNDSDDPPPTSALPEGSSSSNDNMAPVRAAGIMIYRVLMADIQYLLLQASYQGHHWSPPKGHLDPGEDNITAAVRETEEEAGLSRDQYELDSSYPPIVLKYEVKHKPKTVEYLLAKLTYPETPIKISREHQDFKWVNVDEALSMTYADLGEAIQKADKHLREKGNNCP